jgi:hypothetical protein
MGIAPAGTTGLGKMTPSPGFTAVLRYGAFLPSIPFEMRVGDYVHFSCRIVNIIQKRLTKEGSLLLTQEIRAQVFFIHFA